VHGGAQDAETTESCVYCQMRRHVTTMSGDLQVNSGHGPSDSPPHPQSTLHPSRHPVFSQPSKSATNERYTEVNIFTGDHITYHLTCASALIYRRLVSALSLLSYRG